MKNFIQNLGKIFVLTAVLSAPLAVFAADQVEVHWGPGNLTTTQQPSQPAQPAQPSK